jgi:hypothetical protein
MDGCREPLFQRVADQGVDSERTRRRLCRPPQRGNIAIILLHLMQRECHFASNICPFSPIAASTQAGLTPDPSPLRWRGGATGEVIVIQEPHVFGKAESFPKQDHLAVGSPLSIAVESRKVRSQGWG